MKPIQTQEEARREVRKLRQKIGKIRNLASQLERRKREGERLSGAIDDLKLNASGEKKVAKAIKRCFGIVERGFQIDRETAALRTSLKTAIVDMVAILDRLKVCTFEEAVKQAAECRALLPDVSSL